MVKITSCISMLVLMLSVQILQAQTEKDSLKLEVEQRKEDARDYKQIAIDNLNQEKENIIAAEKEKLKETVKAIQEQLDKKEITAQEAQTQKETAAKLAAQNIENKTAIIDNKIALVERGEDIPGGDTYGGTTITLGVGVENPKSVPGDDNKRIYGIDVFSGNKKIKYDVRTSSDAVIAFGFNNAIMEVGGLNRSPYSIGKSKFFEIGYMWTTRLFKEHNKVRFRYGLSLQMNGLRNADNEYFVKEGDETYLIESPYDLRKSKLRMDNFVLPFFFEFGPSKITKKETYIRYSTRHKFKVGVGGYAGVNYGTVQKLKYKVDGDRKKDKSKNNYNTSNFIYGLAAYIGRGDTSLYCKYDLNTVFYKTGTDQHNISLGVRFDL